MFTRVYLCLPLLLISPCLPVCLHYVEGRGINCSIWDDDPGLRKNLRNDLNDVIVDLYNRNQSATLCRGVKHPKSIPIIATNYALRQEER